MCKYCVKKIKKKKVRESNLGRMIYNFFSYAKNYTPTSKLNSIHCGASLWCEHQIEKENVGEKFSLLFSI